MNEHNKKIIIAIIVLISYIAISTVIHKIVLNNRHVKLKDNIECLEYNVKLLEYNMSIRDSIIKEQLDSIDYYRNIVESIDTNKIIEPYCDTISSLKAQIFIKDYKIQRAKEYCNIVKKNPSQLKYLRGWINRCLE